MFAFSRFLLCFTEVAHQGSFRKAPEVPHVSASSIDRQILCVEQELAMPFFECYPAGLRLIVAGELLLHAASNWRKNFTRAREQLDDLRGLRRGYVRIATIDAIGRHFFPTMLKEVHKHYPSTSFILTTIDDIHVQQTLIFGEADFGIMLNSQTFRELQARVSAEINMGIVVLVGHSLASRSAVRFGRYIDYPLILPSALSMISEPVETLVNISGSEMKEVAVSNNIRMIRVLTKKQMGIGTLCRLDILDEIESGQLVFVPLTDSQLKPFTLALCVSPTRQLSFAASAMLNQLEILSSQL